MSFSMVAPPCLPELEEVRGGCSGRERLVDFRIEISTVCPFCRRGVTYYYNF
ncbi:hypothetical protein Hanom_Chr16g01471601 [Helianthus anomalus]